MILVFGVQSPCFLRAKSGKLEMELVFELGIWLGCRKNRIRWLPKESNSGVVGRIELEVWNMESPCDLVLADLIAEDWSWDEAALAHHLTEKDTGTRLWLERYL